jgi:hypothetical protein
MMAMPARKPPPPDEKPQFERFIETARQIGAAETDDMLERAITKIAPAKLPVPSDARPRGEKRARSRD